MPNHLFDGLFANSADDTAFAVLPHGETKTYRVARARSAQIANVLTSLEIKPGDRVAVQVPKTIEMVFLYLACVRLGAIFLPLNTAYTPSEVSYFLQDSGARLFICDPKDEAAATKLAQQCNAQLQTMGAADASGQVSGSLVKAADDAEENFENTARSGTDLAAILYTSGTTGRSKGAMLTQDNLLSNSKALASLWQFTKQDVLLHALPIFHTHGLFVAINVTLLSGCSMIFLPGFNVDDIIENLPRSTALMGVPTFYTRLLNEKRFTRELVSHMRLFVSGSAPLLAETHVQFENRTGHRVLERYGMTETNMNTSNPYDGERRAGTVGFALPGVNLRICNPDTGEKVGQGEVGVIEVKGPNVFEGYWNMPEKTAEEFRADGYFITGDLGTVDSDGYVQIVGRSKDLIISGGYNIYPKEIELILDEQEGVLESAVIGVPHPDFGEAVVAVMVGEGDGFDHNQIMENISGELARFKQPKLLHQIDELPRNTMGKVQKNVLRDMLKDSFKD